MVLYYLIRAIFDGLGKHTLSVFNVLHSGIGSLRSLTQFYLSANTHVPALMWKDM